MNIVPTLLIKNEEVWIRRVVQALDCVFPRIIICDTGSTDSTVLQIKDIPNVVLHEVGTQTPQGLTDLRQYMQDESYHSYGASHIFLVDGDELYPTKYLQSIVDNPMPSNALSGFTVGIEVGEKENGELWFYGIDGAPVILNRQAIIPVTSRWKGVYPFESPDCYEPGNPLNHYFPVPNGLKGFYHLHHTTRSTFDADAYLRVQKRHHFSLKEAPEIVMEKFWLKSEREYRDE